MPPPIPPRKEEGQNEGSISPPIPVRSPKRPPVGAVATAMVSGQGRLPPGGHIADEEVVEDENHSRNPYDLRAIPGSVVTASYPFRGEENLQQLSFLVGDQIKVKQKEDMWSWGVLERNGEEGWFPHNYVGTTFKPLPGIHEMAAKIRERREKLEAAQDQADTAASARNPMEGSHSASAMQLPLGAKSLHESGSVSTGAALDEAPSSTGLAAGVGESTEVMTSPAKDPGAQAEEASGGGFVSADSLPEAAVLVAANSETARVHSQPSTATPSLPPFFKEAPSSKGAATVVQSTAATLAEDNTAEVVDDSRIRGVGFADKSVTPGCKCIVM